jgi:NDP-sugar pyrophosphorylase family protein
VKVKPNMKAVIFVGGKGTRLRPLTNDRPKTMVEVGGKPIIEWQINWLKRCGVRSLLLSGGAMIDVIIKHVGDGSKFGVEVDYLEEKMPLGTSGALNLAKSKLKDEKEFFALYGDELMSFDINKLVNQSYMVTVLLLPFRSPYGIVKTDGSRIVSFEEKPIIKGHWINGGVYHMTSEIFDYLPEVGELAIDTLPKLATKGKLGYIKEPDSYFKLIDSMKDLEEANKDFAAGKIPA